MKLFRRQKSEEGIRRVFGFFCSPQLADDVRVASGQLSLPYYPVAEHCLETGLTQIVADMESDDTRVSLRDHLVESHFLKPLFNAGNNYDQETSIRVRRWQLRRWELDRTAHALVALAERENIPAKVLIRILIDFIKSTRDEPDYRNAPRRRW